MTQEIIEMARDSGMELYGLGKNRARFVHHLEAFAKLVAEKALADHAMQEVQRLGQEIEQEPKEEKLHPIHIGVDVTKEGAAVTAFYRKPDAVMEMFYSQFHPMAQPEQEPVAHLWECIGRWSAYLVSNGKQANCAPPSWLVDAVNNATAPPQRTEQNFCPRCGKRTRDIHTCTPPKD